MRNKKPSVKSYTKVQPDLVHNSTLVAKLINHVMKDGRKTVAAKLVYEALDILAKESGKPALDYLKEALENVKPELEIRSRRVGGANYQVPMPVRADRKETLAIRWILKSSTERPNKTYHTYGAKLAAEIMDAHENLGGAVKKKLDTQKMAEANKAFAHFRW